MAARRNLTPQQTPLIAHRSRIEHFWGSLLLPRLYNILPRSNGAYTIAYQEIGGLTVDLNCENFPHQRFLRQRGGYVNIIPLLATNGEDIDYWVSLHQSWKESQKRSITGFLYHTTSISVYFGPEAETNKLQLFRAEWPGVQSLPDGGIIFEAPGAGHPHWQVDVYQDRIRSVETERQRLQELIHALQEMAEVEEFGDLIEEEISNSTSFNYEKCLQRLSRIHFAQRAPWPLSPWQDDDNTTALHATSPQNLTEVANWCLSTIYYTIKELNR